MSSKKSHKPMADSEWLSRLRSFARTGTWPSGEGNRPAPRQKKWYELYQRIEKCPMQSRGQMSLFGVRTCVCGFHIQKAGTSTAQQPAVGASSSAQQPAVGASSSAAQQPAVGASSSAAQQPAVGASSSAAQQPAVGTSSSTAQPGLAGTSSVHPAVGVRRPPLNLAKFMKPRFGGAQSDAAKPNLSLARKKPKLMEVTVTTTAEVPHSTVVSVAQPQLDVPASLPPGPVSSASTAGTETDLGSPQLPRLWAEGLPPEDHKWILKTLLRVGPKGKLELQDHLKLWYYPPQPGHLYHQAPTPDRFFAHPLLVWMPYKLWKVKVVCPNPACGGHQLTGAGLHKRARRVLDVDRIYNLVTETLTCTKCRASHVSWSQTILSQLDLAHRSEFRVILTQKFACDIRVIRLLRERGLGNSPTRLLKQLKENHTEEWLNRVARYTTECVHFLQRPGLLPVTFPEPPQPAVVPSCKWLLSVYSQDILTRLDDIRARITSIYGSILKMDSTKKITRKLAGVAKGTAMWLTSVGNEFGQILISVLTAQEGSGLDIMAADLITRYQRAGVDPPVALYVDCGCCTEAGETKLQARFSGWPDLTIRLDIWHFMRRLAVGCTTDAHQLYPIFMSRLSLCIFEWDAADVALLMQAKRQQLLADGLSLLSDADIRKHLSREELALHCRRRTRGESITIQLLDELLQRLMGPTGNDSLGVPLLDRERMEHIWGVQRKHVKCIQDPPGVALYIKTGEQTKGGVRLPTYRCARGSTSLESFHLHLNRFIPGTSANSLNFQVYLLEGLHRWNQDRGVAALSSATSGLRSYQGDLLHCVNLNYERLFGKKVVPEFSPPCQYTGELIGVQYLYRQTGQALQDMHPDSEETAQLLEEHDVEDVEEDEGFSDIAEDPTLQDLEVQEAPATPTPGPPFTSSGVVSSAAPSTITPILGPSTAAASTSHLASGDSVPAAVQVEDEDMAVDDQNVPGYQHVDRLSEYLVGLRGQTSLCLSNNQAKTIIELWQKLDDRDKQRVVYMARHQERLLSGRFRTPKKPTTTPGVESTTRCVLGASSAPAQWPDCCRLVENIFLRLCVLHPAPVRKGKHTDSRWSLILRDYHNIRELVVSNSLVMQQTEIQLVVVNQSTLIQWHNNRQKKQELSVLLQGTNLPEPLSTSAQPLQEAQQLPPAPTVARQEHQYRLPENTAGQARQRQAASGQPRTIRPKAPVNQPVFFPPVTPHLPAPQVLMPPPQAVSYVLLPLSQVQGATVPLSAPATTGTPKRAYRRTVEANTCKKCGQFRTADTGHSQYHGRVYCPNFEALSKKQWLEEMRKKEGDK